jgi:putative acetyltransferase
VVKVRLYQSQDNSVLARLCTETVRAINSADYSPEQVEAWASNPPDLERWRGQLAGRIVLVAEDDSEILGFATFEANGHLDHLYVHSRFQGMGVASLLLRKIEGQAAFLGINHIFTEASVTARPFFEHSGFRMVTPQRVEVDGVPFLNYRMEKLLTRSN